MKITEWMDSITDDTVEFSNMQDISYERINERTMKKIKENGAFWEKTFSLEDVDHIILKDQVNF